MTALRIAEITADNVDAAIKIRGKPGQEKFVAPVADSLAEAYVTPTAWPRVVYDGDAVTAFVMANFDPDNEVPEFRCGIWRLLVAAEGQGRGPEEFYLKMGFAPTGRLYGEVVGAKEI